MATPLTESQVRDIIQDELSTFIKSDRFTFEKLLQILDGRNIQLGKGTGTKIGTATDQKLGFWNATPVDQPDTISDPSGAGSAGVDTPARTAINSILDLLQEIGAMQ